LTRFRRHRRTPSQQVRKIMALVIGATLPLLILLFLLYIVRIAHRDRIYLMVSFVLIERDGRIGRRRREIQEVVP